MAGPQLEGSQSCNAVMSKSFNQFFGLYCLPVWILSDFCQSDRDGWPPFGFPFQKGHPQEEDTGVILVWDLVARPPCAGGGEGEGVHFSMAASMSGAV